MGVWNPYNITVRIFHKIFIGMVFSATLPLVISGWWTIKLVRKENTQRVNLLLSSSAQNLADAVHRYISANVSSVRASLRNFSPGREHILQDILSAFENVSFIGANGHFAGDASFFEKNYGNGIFLDEDVIIFSSPDVKVALLTEPILRMIYSFSLGKTGRAQLKKISSERTSEIIEFEEGGVRYIAASSRVRDSDFSVLVSMEKSEIEKLWLNILYQLIFWIGVGVLLAFSSAFVITGGLTTPLKRIAEVAREYSKLDFSKKLVCRGKDEVAELTKAFSAMADEIERAWDEIRRWNQELERRVEERTIQLKKTHDNLLIAEKIAAVGTLGAGVSHEINNPLSAALGFTQILRIKIQDEQLVRYFDSIIRNLQRVKTIVERLRNFSEVQMKADYKSLDPNEIVIRLLSDIQTQDKKVELETHPVQNIYADEEQLATALYEIIKNAIQASKSRVRIRTYQEGDKVMIEVEDDGEEGIPQEIQTRIFEPFFTLKKWEGIGLGLTIARTIIQNIRGAIDVSSSPGRTVFRVIVDTGKNREIGEFLKGEVERIKTHLV